MANVFALNPYGENVGTNALSTADALTNLISKYGQNKTRSYQNYLAEQTMPGAIEFENLKNRLGTQYLPQEKQLGIQKDLTGIDLLKAQIAEAQARRGLIGAQTNVLGQKENPFAQFNMTLNAYNQAENGSPQKQYFGALLNKMIGAGNGIAPAVASTSSSSSGLGGGNMSMAPWVRDEKTGQPKSGAGAVFFNPQTGERKVSLTTQQTSREQKTIAGIENLKKYISEIAENVPDFLTFKERSILNAKGKANYYLGKNYSEPSKYMLGQSAIFSAAEGFINAFGLNATNENVERAVHIMTPMKGESKNGYKARMEKQLSEFISQQQRAEGRLGEGISLGQTTEPVSQGGFFSATGYVPPSVRQPESTNETNVDPLGIR